MSDQPGGGAPPPPGQPPQAPPPQAPPPQAPPPQAPPPQNWQSTPQPPGPPPAGGGQAAGMPSWTSNITDQTHACRAGRSGACKRARSRIIALIIDLIILGIIGAVVNVLTTSILGDNYLGIFGSNFRTQSLIGAIVAVAIMLAVTGAYFVCMWTRMDGATVGMKVMKIAVRDQATGGPITQGQAISRWLFLGAPWAINFLYGWSIGLLRQPSRPRLLHLPARTPSPTIRCARACTTSRPRRWSPRSR